MQVTKVLYESCDDYEEDFDKLEDGNKGVYLSECEGWAVCVWLYLIKS